MTSKNLFFNLMKEDRKRRLWVFALLFLAAFFSMTVLTAMNLSSYGLVGMDPERHKEFAMNIMGDSHLFVPFWSIIAALLCGFSGFSYLHSKSKVDFYHSLPIRRGSLFAAFYLNGIFFYLAAYLVNWLLCLILMAANGAFYPEALSMGFETVGYHFAYFLLIYSVVILSTILTGNLVVGILGFGVLAGYGPLLCYLIDGYYSTMFRTYFHRGDRLVMRLMEYTSPLSAYLSGHSAWGALAAFFVLTALSAYLFGIRRSEAAGKAMAFRPSMAPIKVALVLAASMVGGIIFYTIMGSGIWMLFGTVCGCLLSYSVVEIIYHFDFRQALAHKGQLALCAAGSILICFGFYFDLFGYDSYLPEQSQLESVAVNFYNKENWVPYEKIRYNEYMEQYTYDYVSSQSYRLDTMELTDWATVYPLLERAVEYTKAQRKGNTDAWYAVLDSDSQEWHPLTDMQVCYRLKSGRTVYREYSVWMGEDEEALKALLDSREYKEGVYPLLKMDADELKEVVYRETEDVFGLKLSADQRAELLAAYQQDLLSSTMKSMEDAIPIGTISFIDNNRLEQYLWLVQRGDITDERSEWLSYYCQYPVYQEYQNTARLLAQYGVGLNRSLLAEDVSEIRISDYAVRTLGEKERNGVEREIAINENGYYSVGYDEEEEIKALLESMVYSEYSRFNPYLELDQQMDINVVVEKENGSSKTFPFDLVKSKTPEFLKKDLRFDLTRPEQTEE